MKLFRNVKFGIFNLIKWFLIVWNDRDWDYYYLCEILRKKLISMENYYKNYGMHTKAEEDSKKIKECVMLLNRIIADDYFVNAYKHHDKKWGESKINVNENGYLDITYNNVKTEDDEEIRKVEFKNCMEKENYLMKQDIDYLFDIMKKNLRKWWD